MGAASLSAGDFLQSRIYFTRALELAERGGDLQRRAVTLHDLALVLFYLGDWKQAVRQLERAARVAGSTDGSRWKAEQNALLGRVYLLQGKEAEARLLLESSLEPAQSDGDFAIITLVHLTLAEHELSVGQADSALRRLEPLLSWTAPEHPSYDSLLACRIDLVAARATLANVQDPDRIPRGEALVLQAIQQAMTSHSKPDFMEALWAQGLVRLHQRRWDEAERLLSAALSVARQMPYPQREASILQTWGEMLLARGDAPAASQRFEAALTIYRKLGARPDVERLEGLLAMHRESEAQ
jgi:tetratricopeptide (TPR) repeat protein